MDFQCLTVGTLLLLVHLDMAPRLRLSTIYRGTWKPCTNLYLVHVSYLKQKKYPDTKLRIESLTNPLICR